jgi:hypothetical protein
MDARATTRQRWIAISKASETSSVFDQAAWLYLPEMGCSLKKIKIGIDFFKVMRYIE